MSLWGCVKYSPTLAKVRGLILQELCPPLDNLLTRLPCCLFGSVSSFGSEYISLN